MSVCRSCTKSPVAPGRRLYCGACGPRASAIWKRNHRREFRTHWIRDGKQGPPPWLDNWASVEARRLYQKTYMKKWRAARRASAVFSPHEIAVPPSARVSQAKETMR